MVKRRWVFGWDWSLNTRLKGLYQLYWGKEPGTGWGTNTRITQHLLGPSCVGMVWACGGPVLKVMVPSPVVFCNSRCRDWEQVRLTGREGLRGWNLNCWWRQICTAEYKGWRAHGKITGGMGGEPTELGDQWKWKQSCADEVLGRHVGQHGNELRERRIKEAGRRVFKKKSEH